MIAAIGKNRELGQNNKLLWHIPEDAKRFKDLTEGHAVIMGRKTYESLPEKFRPLPNRTNIVVTRNSTFTTTTAQLIVVNSLEAAIEAAKKIEKKEIFIIGGAQIYGEGIKYADKLYLTLVDKEYPDADAFFPDYSEFKKIVYEEARMDGKYSYKFIDLGK